VTKSANCNASRNQQFKAKVPFEQKKYDFPTSGNKKHIMFRAKFSDSAFEKTGTRSPKCLNRDQN